MTKKIDLRSLLMPLDTTGSSDSQESRASTASQITEMVLGAMTSPPLSSPTPVAEIPTVVSSILPGLLELKSEILRELESNLNRLLSLNPTRREAIAARLEQLAGVSAPRAEVDPSAALRRWVEDSRTPNRNIALQRYFEEVALIVLGQSLLLKAWSDRGIRGWARSDLGNLNWAFNRALKPSVPLDRDGWQITIPNLYSWYVPSPPLQDEIWNRLDPLPLTAEGPTSLELLLNSQSTSQSSLAPQNGYDSRFLKALWGASPGFGFESNDAASIPRRKMAFSPTLRDGTMVRTGPVSVHWIGTEASQFQLLSAELLQLWWGPAAPPLWANGNGLETHSRDQLTLGLGSSKPSLISKIAEIESCDISFVLEETALRAQGRTSECQHLRDQLETLPFFKKLKRPSTTLGAMQACTALSKLRPGGLLWWAREEPIAEGEGSELLNFLLDRARIVCEWDFSGVHHALPSSGPLFPRHLYLLVRENRIEDRLAHRPLRVAIQGSVRSHVEIPLLLQDSFASVHQSPGSFNFHGQWEIQISKSPTSQQEWAERWPDPACQNTLRLLDRLRNASMPLAHVVTIRKTPEADAERPWSMDPSLFGFWMDTASPTREDDRRKLQIRPLPRPGQEVCGTGFVVLLSDESWIAPLGKYLQSAVVEQWLDQHAERKANRWCLDEQTVRWLPIPKALIRALGASGETDNVEKLPALPQPLPGEWEKLASELSYRPKKVLEALHALSPNPVKDETVRGFHATLFVRTARAIEQMQNALDRLKTVIREDGTVRWNGILDILPKTEPMSLPLHPLIKITGNLPLHVPVSKIERVKAPSNGILLLTEIGLHMMIASDNPRIIDLIDQQLEGAAHPTWSELLEHLRVPRRMEFAEATASDLLRTYGEQTARVSELFELLSACQLF